MEELFLHDNGQWELLEKSEGEPPKPPRPGTFHNETHAIDSIRGDKLVRYPKKMPSGEIEYGYRKIPNKVKIVHTWDDHSKEWKHSGTNATSSGAEQPQPKTPMDAAKERQTATESKQEPAKPKTVLRRK